VRYNPAEKDAIRRHAVRCFCLSRQDLTGAEMAGRFLTNLDSIVTACQLPGPFVFAVQERRIQSLEI
jgi:hypothetical protein